MKLKGIDQLINKLEVDIDTKSDNLLKKTGAYVFKDVKLNTPVDTGRLKRSWKMDRDLNKVTISNNTSYARHVEFGHRTRSSAEGGGVKVVTGRHMLRNSVERGKVLLAKEMADIKIFGGD